MARQRKTNPCSNNSLGNRICDRQKNNENRRCDNSCLGANVFRKYCLNSARSVTTKTWSSFESGTLTNHPHYWKHRSSHALRVHLVSRPKKSTRHARGNGSDTRNSDCSHHHLEPNYTAAYIDNSHKRSGSNDIPEIHANQNQIIKP